MFTLGGMNAYAGRIHRIVSDYITVLSVTTTSAILGSSLTVQFLAVTMGLLQFLRSINDW